MTAVPEASDLALLAAFEAGTIPPAEFHHRDHVRVAWSLLRSCPPVEALTRLSLGLRRLAKAAGKPERYHETITWAFLARGRGWARREPVGCSCCPTGRSTVDS